MKEGAQGMDEHSMRQMQTESHHNGHKSPQEIEAQINHTRAELSETLDAISRKLSPGELVDQALGYLRGPNEFVSHLGESVKRNPVPVALVGIGLSWLMVSGREGSMPQAGGQRAETSGPSLGERMAQVGDRVQSGTEQVRTQVGAMSERLHEHSARAQQGMQNLWQEQPLVVGMLGLALGAVVGALLPSSRREDELMGEQRDEVLRKAAQLGEERMHDAAEAAHLGVEQAPEPAAASQPSPPGMH